MGAILNVFPASCSRLRIFLCYAREDRELAREIAQTLTNDGHDVFIDANSLRVATNFNEEIRRAIGRADRFVFLASRHSLAPDAYPQTELGFAQKRWPSPKGTVWPVLVDPSLDPAELPLYLRSVQVHTPRGNVVADLAAELEASRTLRASCIATAAAALLFAAGGAWAVTAGGPASYKLNAPDQVVLKPMNRPGPDNGWLASPATLTLIPVSYTNDSNKTVRLQNEAARLTLADRAVDFTWFNVVEMQENCPDWLCYKALAGPETVPPHGNLKREVMYRPAGPGTLSWQTLVKALCKPEAETLEITLAATTRSSALLGASEQTRSVTCRINLAAVRREFDPATCRSPDARLPSRIVQDCARN